MQSFLDYSLIKEQYRELSKGIKKAIQLSKQSNEEKLKISVLFEFEKFFNKFGFVLNELLDYEQISIGGIKFKGRGDIVSGSLIMEFKTYNLLTNPAAYNKALKQVVDQYLLPIDKKIAKYFTALIFDGESIVFIRFDEKEEEWISSKKSFNDFVLYDWVLLISQTIKKPVSSNALKNSFSIHNNLSQEIISILYLKLQKNISSNERVKMLFDEWDKSFSYIYGGILNERKIKQDFEEIFDLLWKSSIKSIEVNKFLFCFYTYYALIVKLYASEISSSYMPVTPDSPINALLRTKKLKEAFAYIESGNFYKDYAHVDNYIEGGFFSWHLDAWDDETEKVIKGLLHELNKYDFQTVVNDELNSRDILKSLYQEIIPKKIRHDLGEYYTPKWLIESVLNDVGIDGDLDKRILDAGCGSGGFLVESINRIKKKNRNKPSEEVLIKIMDNVIGFDVNPVAVLTARTNYLLAISHLLKDKKKPIPITIPVYLADSIITPTAEGQSKLPHNSYLISTVEGLFSLPKSLVDNGYLNDAMRLIEDCLEDEYPASDFEAAIKKSIRLSEEDAGIIVDFYRQINRLHNKNKNRIWVKIIQNSFAPLLHKDFDFVVGNPPWIKWDFLSREYKAKLGRLYLDIYKLFSHKGMKAGLGYSNDDISVVFMYVAMDKYLKDKGKLGFVMKQTLYKTIAGKEFRKFMIEKGNKKTPLKVLKVNDMLELKPFNTSAQAETSTIIIKKGEQTTYPVKYDLWKIKKELPKEDSSLKDVINNVEIIEKEAYPHNAKDLTDIWIFVDKGKQKRQYTSGKNFYRSRHGIVNDLNAVFFIDILKKQDNEIEIINCVTNAKKKVNPLNRPINIESGLVYPFLKPKSIGRWKIKSYVYGILPQRKNGESNESELRQKYALTYGYLHRYKENLLDRSSKWFKTKGFPFYSVFGVGGYTFQKYKIVWCCMSYAPNFTVVSEIKDKFIGTKSVMPDNTIGYISTDNEQEAYYICALLNSNMPKQFFEDRSSKSKWGISINMVNSFPISKFDKNNKIHIGLVNFSKQAHNTDIESEIKKIETEINKLAEKILIK